MAERFMEPEEYAEYLKTQIKRNPEMQAPVAQMNLYQMNKDLVKSLKRMNNMDINHALEKVRDWYDEHNACMYFALLNHEKHYFTIFHEQYEGDALSIRDNFIDAVKDILMNYYGDKDIRAIDVNGEAVEIWAIWDGEPTVGYLFPYDQGVVKY